MKVVHYWYAADERIKNPISGFENHLIILLENLVKEKISVELILNYSFIGPKLLEITEKLRLTGVNITLYNRRDDFQLPKNIIQKFIYHLVNFIHLFKIFRKGKRMIFHFHLDLVWTPFIAILSGVNKIVLSVHNDEPRFSNRKFKIWFKILQLINSKVTFIAITDHVHNYMIEKAGIRKNRIHRIYYGFPKTIQKPKMQIFDDGTVVGFIGRMTKQKNIPVLLEAVSKIDNINLVLMGEGELLDDLLLQTENLGISDRVKFLGYVKDAGQYINSFDIFCLPSDWEGLGIVLIESMQAKTLIVASDAGAIPEILGHGKYGLLFKKGDYKSLKAQLIKAIHSEQKQQIVVDAYKYSNNNFTVENMVRETIRIYNKLDNVIRRDENSL